jgi:hypothetical protein
MTWNRKDTWVCVFDILGFSNKINEACNDFSRLMLTSQLDDIFETLQSDIMTHGELEYIAFSDTITIFSPNLEVSSYPWFLLQCTSMIEKSIDVRLPMRGAISVGTAFACDTPPIIIGPSFLEAHEYCEDQDWVGLLLSPSATIRLKNEGIEPLHHDFVNDEIPLRNKEKTNVMAYRFQNGSASFESPHLMPLGEMMSSAPNYAQHKYQRTIEFIKKHYQYLNGINTQ